MFLLSPERKFKIENGQVYKWRENHNKIISDMEMFCVDLYAYLITFM